MGQTALLPLRRKACSGFFRPEKNPTASAGFEPANLGTKGQHANSRPPKTLYRLLLTNTYAPSYDKRSHIISPTQLNRQMRHPEYAANEQLNALDLYLFCNLVYKGWCVLGQ